MKKVLIIFCFLSFYYCGLHAQVLTFTENPSKTKTIATQVPEDKIMLVFESDGDLSFDSSMEPLEQPKKNGNIYTLIISQRKCVINVENKKNSSIVPISFGQMSENSLPTLQKGEIRYFEISEETKLNVFDNTLLQKAGGAVDNQMLYEKEALLIITTDPVNLNLKFMSSAKITDVKKEKNRYFLYITPISQTINVLDLDSKAFNVLNISNVKVKDVFYYFVSLPSFLLKESSAEAFKPASAADFLTLAYSDYNMGNTKGALDNLMSYVSVAENVLIEPSMLLNELLNLEKSKDEAKRYFEDAYKKNPVIMNQFMVYYVNDDYNHIEKMTNDFPDFLPAKVFYIKHMIKYYSDNVLLWLSSPERDTKYCQMTEWAEGVEEEVKSIEKVNKSKYFLKPQTISSSFFTSDEKNFFKDWGQTRIVTFSYFILSGIKDEKSRTEIIDECVSGDPCSGDTGRKLANKLYDELLKK